MLYNKRISINENYLFVANLTAKFSSIKSQYKTKWINKKDEKNKEETSVPESDHYQHLSFLEAIICKEVEESDDLNNVSLNSSCEISETNEVSLLISLYNIFF